MIRWLNAEITAIIRLIQAAGMMFGAWFVIWMFARTRSMIALLVALLTAGIFVWGLFSIDTWFKKRIQEEANRNALGRPPVVRVVSAPASPLGVLTGKPASGS